MERSAWNDVKVSLPSKMSTSEEDEWVDLTWNHLADGKVSIIDEAFNVVFSASAGDPMGLGKLSSAQEVADDSNARVVTTRGGPAGTQWRFTFPNKQSAAEFDAISKKAEDALRKQQKAAASPADEDDHCEELAQRVQERYRDELYPPMIFRGAELFGPSTAGGNDLVRLGRGCFMLLDTKTKEGKDGPLIRHYNLYFFDEDEGASQEIKKFTISKHTVLTRSKDKPEEVAEMFTLMDKEATGWGLQDVKYELSFDEKYVAASFLRDWLPRYHSKNTGSSKEEAGKEHAEELAAKEKEHQKEMSRTLGARIRQFIVFVIILLAVVAALRFAMHFQNNREEALGLLKKDIGNSADIAHGAFKAAAAGVCGAASGDAVAVDALKSCLELGSKAKINDCVADLVDRATAN